MLDDRFKEERARDALAFDPLPESSWVSLEDRGIVIRVRYSEALSKLLRGILCSKWDAADRSWIVPYSSSDALRPVMTQINELAAAAQESAEIETIKRIDERRERETRLEHDRIERKKHLGQTSLRPLQQHYLTPEPNTPLHHFSLESIGDNQSTQFRSLGVRPSGWVAQIFGIDQKNKFIRSYLSGYRDYRHSNSRGSRGVMINYHLAQGPIYEICAPTSWRQRDRYFLRIINNDPRKMSNDEVRECLVKLV